LTLRADDSIPSNGKLLPPLPPLDEIDKFVEPTLK
jgi:hypothetical protein